MVKTSTLLYILDNNNTEENIEIAGNALNYEYSDIIEVLRNLNIPAPENAVKKVLELSRKQFAKLQ